MPSPIKHPYIGRRGRSHRGRYHALIPLTSLGEAGALLPAAQALSAPGRGQVTILYVIQPATGGAGGTTAAEVERVQRALDALLSDQDLDRERVTAVVRVAQEVWREIAEMVDRLGIDLVVLGWRGDSPLEINAGQPGNRPVNVMAQELVVIRSEDQVNHSHSRPIFFSPRKNRTGRSETRAETNVPCRGPFRAGPQAKLRRCASHGITGASRKKSRVERSERRCPK